MALYGCMAGGGGAPQETNLWTNPSPNSQFNEQYVTLSDSVDNYDYIKFTFAYSNSYMSVLRSVTYTVDEIKSLIGGNDEVYQRDFACSPAFTSAGDASYYIRPFCYDPPTGKIYFRLAINWNGKNTTPGYAKPTTIVGIKY